MQSNWIRRTAGLTTAVIALAGGLATAATASARTRRQTGQTSWVGTGSDPYWDAASNWSTGESPSGSVDEMVFPVSSSSCLDGWCSYSVDDVPNLALGTLTIDPGQNYVIVPMTSADTLSLSGGIVFQGATPQTAEPLVTQLQVPITLSAAQSWNLAGVPGTPSSLAVGTVTGSAFPLSVNVPAGTAMTADQLDTGPLTISGGGVVRLLQPGPDAVPGGATVPAPIIGSQGVRLARGASLTLLPTGTVSGAITIAPGSASRLRIGNGKTPDATVTVNGDLTLRTNSGVQFFIDDSAPQGTPQPLPGSDYSQLTSTGAVHLNGAALILDQGLASGSTECANLRAGQTYTLISSYGPIGGRFAGIGSARVIPIGGCDSFSNSTDYDALITYNTRSRPETVNATIIGPAQIKALVAQTLTAPAGRLGTIAGIRRLGGYTESFDAPTAGNLTLTWIAVVHHRRMIVARAGNTANQVGPRRLVISLTAAGRRLLRRSRRLTLTATAQFTPSGGSAISVSRRIQLN